MTVRLSEGLSLSHYYMPHGTFPFFLILGKMSVKDLEVSAIDADHCIGIEFKQDESIQESSSHFQYAILHTNTFG